VEKLSNSLIAFGKTTISSATSVAEDMIGGLVAGFMAARREPKLDQWTRHRKP